MQRYNEMTLSKALAENPARLYLLAGNDGYLLDGCFGLIRKSVLGGDDNALFRFSQKELSDGAFEELFYSISMLGSQRLAVVEDYSATTISTAQRDLLASLLPEIPDDLTVVLRYQSDDRRFSVPKKAEEVAALCKQSAVVLALAKEGAELERYIASIAKREGCAIEQRAARELVLLCGDDLLMIQSEIKKLAALSGYTAITAAHVEALGVRTAEAGVYKMLSAIEAGKTETAAGLLRTMLDDLEEPLAIAAVLNTAFINLYRARLTRDAGHSINYMTDHFNYRKGDRKVSIAFDNCRKYTLAKLERAVGILFELDGRLKSSAADHRILFEQKVIELAMAVAP